MTGVEKTIAIADFDSKERGSEANNCSLMKDYDCAIDDLSKQVFSVTNRSSVLVS